MSLEEYIVELLDTEEIYRGLMYSAEVYFSCGEVEKETVLKFLRSLINKYYNPLKVSIEVYCCVGKLVISLTSNVNDCHEVMYITLINNKTHIQIDYSHNNTKWIEKEYLLHALEHNGIYDSMTSLISRRYESEKTHLKEGIVNNMLRSFRESVEFKLSYSCNSIELKVRYCEYEVCTITMTKVSSMVYNKTISYSRYR